MAQEFKERTITISLRRLADKPTAKRSLNAKYVIKKAMTKETRLKEFKISNQLNELLWARGKYKPPRKVTIKVINEKGKGLLMLPTEKYEPKQEKKKGEEKKTETPKTEAKKETTTEKKPKEEAKKETTTEKTIEATKTPEEKK